MAYGSNTIITAKGITKDTLIAFKNTVGFSATFDKALAQGHFGSAMPKEGSTLWVRVPNRYNALTQDDADPGRLLPAYVDKSVEEELIPFTIDKCVTIPLTYTDEELAMEISYFSQMYTEPAGEQIATNCDMTGTGLYTQVWNQIGDESKYCTMGDFFDARAILIGLGVQPTGRWTAALNPFATAGISQSSLTQFNPQADISQMYRKGVIGVGAGFNFIEEANMRTHTSGNYGTSAQVVYAPSNSSTRLVMNNFTDLTGDPLFSKGDVLTIGDSPANYVYELNIPNKQKTGRIQQYTVVDVGYYDSGDSTYHLDVNPAFRFDTDDPKRNISRRPAVGDMVYFDVPQNTDYTVNIAYAPQTFYYATVPLGIPAAAGVEGHMEAFKGFNVRFLRQYDIDYAVYKNRLDIVYAMSCLNGGRAVRVKSLARVPGMLTTNNNERGFIKNAQNRKKN